MEIVLATRNPNKKKEILSIVKKLGLFVKIFTLDDFPDCPEVEEDGCTFEENAAKKALSVALHTQKLTLADDSGLMVFALNGAPGVHSARFAGPQKDDALNNQKLLVSLKGKQGADRKAKFVCAIAVAKSNQMITVVHGECDGLITQAPKGKFGFGYDPLFFDPQTGKSFAEITRREKNKVSHRAKALAQLKGTLKNLLM
ncbi:XTP/dITP diphosphatase [PVC group bacterium]|nr:XTP/dITP diphosphatase [PVC group bacterium]